MGPDRYDVIKTLVTGWCAANGLGCTAQRTNIRLYISVINDDCSKGVELTIDPKGMAAFIADKKYPHGGKYLQEVDSILPILKEVFQ